MADNSAEDAVAASYAAAGFANTMGWGARPALLLVDVCRAYWTDGSPLDLRAHAPSAAAPDSITRILRARSRFTRRRSLAPAT